MNTNTANLLYWFTIEPYVFVGISSTTVLLYNTLDGNVVESQNSTVLRLMRNLLMKENNGVVGITKEEYSNEGINGFISLVRKYYMGDLIETSLSKSKPIQILPYCSFLDKEDICGNIKYFPYDDILENLFEINIHVDNELDIAATSSFLQSLPANVRRNIFINKEINPFIIDSLFTLLNDQSLESSIHCSYLSVLGLPEIIVERTSMIVEISFPLVDKIWKLTKEKLVQFRVSAEYILTIKSYSDFFEANTFIEKYITGSYCIKPVYSNDNKEFFEQFVYLTKEDILSSPISMQDIFLHQALNSNDYGKLNILSNGDVHANVNDPMLGNIHTDNILKLIHKEFKDGKSWFRIRNEYPCNKCVYQWLCPSPSDYEREIGKPNLCHLY